MAAQRPPLSERPIAGPTRAEPRGPLRPDHDRGRMMRPCLSRSSRRRRRRRPGGAAEPGDPARASGECGRPGRAAGCSRPDLPATPGPQLPFAPAPPSASATFPSSSGAPLCHLWPALDSPPDVSLLLLGRSRGRARSARPAFCLTLGGTVSSPSHSFLIY